MVRSFTSWYQILCLGYSSIAMTKHPTKAEYTGKSPAGDQIFQHEHGEHSPSHHQFPKELFPSHALCLPPVDDFTHLLRQTCLSSWPRLLLILKILQLLLGLMCVFFEGLIAGTYIHISMIERGNHSCCQSQSLLENRLWSA